MKISSAKVIVTRVVRSTKHPETHYLDLVTSEGDTLNVSTKLLSPEQAQQLHLMPCSFDGDLRVGKYEDRVTFELTSAAFKPLGVPAPQPVK